MKDYTAHFRGEVVVEESPEDGTDLDIFQSRLDETWPRKKTPMPVNAMIGMYSVGLIILGMAAHKMIILHG